MKGVNDERSEGEAQEREGESECRDFSFLRVPRFFFFFFESLEETRGENVRGEY